MPARVAGSFVRRPGLSLLEVILSLAILIMALTAIGLLLDIGSEHERKARLNKVAARLAQSKLAEVEAGIVSFDTTEGEFTDSDSAWSWTMTAESQGANLYMVTITVRAGGRPAVQLQRRADDARPSVRGSAAKLTRPPPTLAPEEAREPFSRRQGTGDRGQKPTGRSARGVGLTVSCLLSPVPCRRQGFTLLEVLLAMLLAMLLMGGLYVALSMSLQQVQTSRDALEIEDVSRAVFNKVSIDLTNILGPSTPNSGGTASSGASAPSTTPGMTTTKPTTGGDMDADDMGSKSTTTPPTSDPGTTDESEGTSTLVALQTGVIGDSTTLSIFASRVPGVLTRPGALGQQTNNAQQARSDLVRIDYWIGPAAACAGRSGSWSPRTPSAAATGHRPE